VTSWADLEAYLRELVKKVGGTAYVLRDTGGRHLVPRPPPVTNAADLFKAIGRRVSVSRLLRVRAEEDAPTGDGAKSTNEEALIRMLYRHIRFTNRFNEHSGVLDAVVGADFVRRGPGKRYVHDPADLPFIAERFVASYLLIIEFGFGAVLEERGAVRALEKARPVICDMLADLPPEDGGDRAVSNAGRVA
jgi:hypothetical protein